LLPHYPSLLLLDNQSWFQSHGVRKVEEIGRGCNHRLMDLGELLLGPVTFYTNGVAQALVARSHSRIYPEETSEIDLAFDLNLKPFESDPSDCALRRIPYCHAGVERCEEVFLRVSKGVAAAQFVWFIDVERESPGNL